MQVLESRQGGAMTERPALACYESVPQTLDSGPLAGYLDSWDEG